MAERLDAREVVVRLRAARFEVAVGSAEENLHPRRFDLSGRRTGWISCHPRYGHLTVSGYISMLSASGATSFHQKDLDRITYS